MDTTPETIITAIKRRLISQVSAANDATCVINANPDAVPQPMTGEFHYGISPAPYFQFDPRMFHGGGKWQRSTDWVFAVTVHSRTNNDALGRDEHVMAYQHL